MFLCVLVQDLEERLEIRELEWRKREQILAQRQEQHEQTIKVCTAILTPSRTCLSIGATLYNVCTCMFVGSRVRAGQRARPQVSAGGEQLVCGGGG